MTAPMLRAVLVLSAIGIMLAYCAVMYCMLKAEKRAVWLALLLVMAVAGGLRVIFAGDYPPGLNGDELIHLLAAWQRFNGKLPLASVSPGAGMHMPLYAIVQGSLWWSGLTYWWAIRLWSLVGGVLSVGGAFAVLRAMNVRSHGALFGAGCVAVFPWSLLYGRVSLGGGQLIWHEMIVLWAIARLTWRDDPWGMPWAALTLGAVLYEYFAGRMLLWLALGSVVLLRTHRQRAYVLLGVLVAFLLYLPAMLQPADRTFLVFSRVGTGAHTVADLTDRAVVAIKALALPVAGDAGMSLTGAAVMPVAALLVAGVGFLVATWRQRLFLCLVFVLGLCPMVAAQGPLSVHRMLVALPVIPLLTGIAVGRLPSRRWCYACAFGLFAYVGWQSVTYFFSDNFWQGSLGELCDVGCRRAPAGTEHGLPAQVFGRPVDAWRTAD